MKLYCMKSAVTLFLLGLSVAVSAEQKGQSVLFQEQKSGDDHLTTLPESQPQSLGDKCMEMSRQIDALKGKPQRRNALMEQFRAECQDRP